MKLLFFQWSAFLQKDIEAVLRHREDIELTCASYDFKDLDSDPYFASHFAPILTAKPYDAVFSVNFFPVLSDLCEVHRIPYISWVYDAPMNVRRVESFANSVNRIYVFDRGQYNDLVKAGFTTVSHLPLGCDTRKIDSMTITDEDRERFSGDISFIGKLYHTPYNEMMAPLGEPLRSFFEALVTEQLNTYGEYFLAERLTDEVLAQANAIYRLVSGNPEYTVAHAEMEFLLANEVTRRERLAVLDRLSERYDVALYSFDSCPELPKVHIRGVARYYSDMPKVFALSKVNLNITLKIIKEGMPLRVLDILGAGGLLLSNYQKELDENFADGQEVLLYRSMDELLAHTEFCLTHEKERREIAARGHARAHELFELETQLSKLLPVT